MKIDTMSHLLSRYQVIVKDSRRTEPKDLNEETWPVRNSAQQDGFLTGWKQTGLQWTSLGWGKSVTWVQSSGCSEQHWVSLASALSESAFSDLEHYNSTPL